LEKYKADVRLFRIAPDKGYREDMQKDHGFNPPPVWTILGRGVGELHGETTGHLQLLAALDLVDLAGMFAALFRAFGWCVLTVSMGIAPSLGQLFICLLSQLTWYCHSFMILAAPLTRVKIKRQIAEGDEE
jgi:hypothetical protein